MISSDLGTANVTSDGVAVQGRVRLKGVVYTHGGTGGSILFKSGGGSGTLRLTVPTPAAAGGNDITFAESGILFEDGVHVTVGDASSVTVLYA